jgi:hypothetical protein
VFVYHYAFFKFILCVGSLQQSLGLTSVSKFVDDVRRYNSGQGKLTVSVETSQLPCDCSLCDESKCYF